ncbi:hypothetical protein HCN44_006191 [Aphidius gifuensis]|uniref:F-box/LRR-repeat protein 15-like leucin rich repeat domain-containing protein n=1 Tax=Aphidius gifuensis TaxID=684658 RepID=A0A834Y1J3_APHGI|nr:hypothetical protein HCN44_006191 [Aphidius gifuensis]
MSVEKLNNIIKDVEQPTCLIDKLDEDCLSILFSFIPTTQLLVTEQVCEKWENASLLTWKSKKQFISIYDENLSYQENLLNQQNIEVILSRWGSQLTHLKLIKTCQSNILPIIVENCEKLVDIVLEFENVDQCDIQNDTSTLSKLKSVDLKYISNQFSTSNSNFIIQFFKVVPDGIDKLKISTRNDPCFESSEFLTTFKKFNAISHLTLNNCQLTDNVVKEISLKKNLIYLDLSHSTITNGYSLVNLVNLKHLNLSHVTGITEDLMQHILTSCKNIINLNIEFCQDITDRSLKNLKNLKCLEYLNVSCIEKITGEFMIQLAINCKNLKHLNLYNCFYIDKYNFEELGKMKNLEYLNLTVNDRNIDEYPIISIANNCHKLTYLGIISTNKCMNISQRAFTKLEQLPFDGKDSNKFLVNYQGRFLGKIHNSWCNSQCGNNQTFVPMYVKIKCEKTCRPNTYNGLSGTSISNNKIKDDKNTTTNSKKEEEIIQKMTNARRFIDEAELYSLKAERAVKSAEKFEMIANLIIESDKSNPGKVSDSSFNSIKTLQKDIKKQSDLTKTYKKNTDIVANKAKSEISDALRAASDSELSSSTKAMIEESNVHSIFYFLNVLGFNTQRNGNGYDYTNYKVIGKLINNPAKPGPSGQPEPSEQPGPPGQPAKLFSSADENRIQFQPNERKENLLI